MTLENQDLCQESRASVTSRNPSKNSDSKPSSNGKSNVAYKVLTDQIISMLERGTVPWRKPWLNGPTTRSYHGRDYRGINQLLLSATASDKGLRGCWLTFNQAKKLGGRVKKGETSTPVIQWKWFEEQDREGNPTGKTFPVAFYYRVFSICQTEGIEDPAWLKKAETSREPMKSLEAAEAIWEGYQGRPTLTHGGDRAAYWVYSDKITMPQMDQFDSAERYHGVLFHEMTHSSGHTDRLNREGITRIAASFGSDPYSHEELIAEMGAAFLAAEAGIQTEKTTEQNAAYIQSWIRALKGEPKLAVIAAAQAQKAVDHILGRKFQADEA